MIDISAIEKLLKEAFNNSFQLTERKPGVFQIALPFFHEDNDMYDIFITSGKSAPLCVCDFGMTTMRLSYSDYDIDSDNKARIFNKITSENGALYSESNIYIEASYEMLYSALMQMIQIISKITTMSLFKREVINAMFYEMLDEIIQKNLSDYNPVSRYTPISGRDELEVDYSLTVNNKNVYLFGVKDSQKARLTTISTLEFKRADMDFNSIIVHEDFESLTKRDRKIITSAADKQFPDLEDFRLNGPSYFKRLAS